MGDGYMAPSEGMTVNVNIVSPTQMHHSHPNLQRSITAGNSTIASKGLRGTAEVPRPGFWSRMGGWLCLPTSDVNHASFTSEPIGVSSAVAYGSTSEFNGSRITNGVPASPMGHIGIEIHPGVTVNPPMVNAQQYVHQRPRHTAMPPHLDGNSQHPSPQEKRYLTHGQPIPQARQPHQQARNNNRPSRPPQGTHPQGHHRPKYTVKLPDEQYHPAPNEAPPLPFYNGSGQMVSQEPTMNTVTLYNAPPQAVHPEAYNLHDPNFPTPYGASVKEQFHPTEGPGRPNLFKNTMGPNEKMNPRHRMEAHARIPMVDTSVLTIEANQRHNQLYC
ncbi:hypothetical protein BJ085DRAFT_36156 [Dimargaris cristalligena]|uniref:Uncharacterized protein n=1 Tax=Dimargaris cristalligena TaxID=215637 RepID=A0A4P9ZT66_9FUNG|nr:hypothetical protein BJ085DRAFT_36156 [Dimargaris cristalligena]|eukprot:RKP36645.1 hypothetical protein BJ085DRAFT_36156 [Dimargaris cristalligena]